MKFKIFAGTVVLSLSVSGVYGMSQGNLRQMIQSGQSVQCTTTKTDAHGTQSGIFYIAEKKVRGDMTFTRSGSAPMVAHMIQNGEWSYMWGGPFGEQQGTKMNVSQFKKPAASAKKSSFDLDKEMAMDCKPWKVSAAQLTPPSDVQFRDMTEQVQGMQQRMATPGATAGNPCAACDAAPPEAKAQCRQALHCQ